MGARRRRFSGICATVVKWLSSRDKALPVYGFPNWRVVWFRPSGLVSGFTGITVFLPLCRTGLLIIPACTHDCRLANRGRYPDGVSMAGPHQPAHAAV